MSLGEAEAARQLAALKARKTGVGRTTLGLDPGTKSTGIGVLRNGTVVFADVIRKVQGAHAKDRLPEMCERVQRALTDLYARFTPDTVALEWQEPREDDPRPRDILHMAIVLGAALAVPRPTMCRLFLPLPVQWKGSIQSAIFERHQRESAIGQGAIDLMDASGVPQGEQHNGLDGITLAAWAINQRLPWLV